MFEASPQSEAVLASQNALLWNFPTPEYSVAISFQEFTVPSFQEELAKFLEQASNENLKRFAARTNKAGTSVFEVRNTVNPALITHMLLTLLECKGARVYPTLLRKRVRDDVCWSDGAEKPWRRSPIWLILRVGNQRHLYTVLGPDAGRAAYKVLCSVLIALLLEDGLNVMKLEALHFLKAKLCRRLAKLESAKTKASTDFQTQLGQLMQALDKLFLQSTDMVSRRITSHWTEFKNMIRRPIAFLPQRIDRRDLILSLPSSRPYLEEVIASYKRRVPPRNLEAYSIADIALQQTQKIDDFAKKYLELAEHEDILNQELLASNPEKMTIAECEANCISMTGKLEGYIQQSLGAYTDPEQTSVLILSALRLWKSMDQSALRLYGGLLANYQACIVSQRLDILQLGQRCDLQWLADIQAYIKDRNSKATFGSIFDEPSQDAFAAKYYDKNSTLQQLHGQIVI